MSAGTRILRRVRQEWRNRRQRGPLDWTLLIGAALMVGYGGAAGFRRFLERFF